MPTSMNVNTQNEIMDW